MALRKTSGVTNARFPFARATTPFVLITPQADDPGYSIEAATKHDDKYALITKAQDTEGATLLAVWPGKDRSDVFVLDDLAMALSSMGATPSSEEA